jgi:hypothetical protein
MLQGLGNCESLRGEVWKLICKVQNLKMQYTSDVYSKFVKSSSQFEANILKDIHRTRSYCPDFNLPSESGKNRLYNVLKAYSAYDPEIGYC